MKTIFITGGASGIGAACVRKFFSMGWNVGAMDLKAADEGEFPDSSEFYEKVLFTQGDIRNASDVKRAAAAVAERFGSIDSVFANAGIHRSDTILDITDEQFDLVVKTNVYGTANTLREVIPHIIKAGGGTVVLNSSDQWFIGKAHSFSYGLTKGAIGQIARSLSIDLAPYHIRVNAICPSTVHTPLVDNVFKRLAEKEKRKIEDCWAEEDALFARGKAGTAEEIAELVYFLASEASSFCTGGHYLADGGLVAG